MSIEETLDRCVQRAVCRIKGHDWKWMDYYQHRDYVEKCQRCGKLDT